MTSKKKPHYYPLDSKTTQKMESKTWLAALRKRKNFIDGMRMMVNWSSKKDKRKLIWWLMRGKKKKEKVRKKSDSMNSAHKKIQKFSKITYSTKVNVASTRWWDCLGFPSYIMRWIKKAIFYLLLRPHERNTMCVNGKAAGWKCRGDRSLLCRQSELLSFQHFGDVEIEKVAIKDGLDTAGEDRDQVEKSLEVVSEQKGGKKSMRQYSYCDIDLHFAYAICKG